MQSNYSSQTWSGALRYLPLILATSLLFSIITLGLATAYGMQMAHAPLDPYYIEHPEAHPSHHRWSNAYFVFSSGTMPLLTILESATDLVLFFTIGLNQIYALSVSVIFLCGWAIQLGFWAGCDISGNWYESGGDTCYQSNLQRTASGGSLVGISDSLGNAKGAFCILLLVLYIPYMSFAAAAVHKRRVQQKIRTDWHEDVGFGIAKDNRHVTVLQGHHHLMR